MAKHTHSIHVKNQEEYNKLMEYVEKLGYRWNGSSKTPTEDRNHFYEREDYILCLKEGKRMTHSTINSCKRGYSNIPISSFHDFVCPIKTEYHREFKRMFRVNRIPNPLNSDQEKISKENNWLAL